MSEELLVLLLSGLVIFCLRILDVSLGTLRIGFLVRGEKRLAGIFSFFESLIWLIAAAEALSNLDSPVKFVAYAGGYAVGTMVGVWIEGWLAMGESILRVIAPVDSPPTEDALRDAGLDVTVLNAQGRNGDVRVLFSVMPRKRIPQIMSLVESVNPEAFITFESTMPMRGKVSGAGAAGRVRK